MGDLVDGAVECLLIGLRRLRRAGDLAHVLKRRVMHLGAARGRLEVVQRTDVPAHTPSLSTAPTGRRGEKRARSAGCRRPGTSATRGRASVRSGATGRRG